MPEAGPPAPQSSWPVRGPERTRAFHCQPRTRQWVPAEEGGGDLGRPAGSSDIRGAAARVPETAVNSSFHGRDGPVLNSACLMPLWITLPPRSAPCLRV